MTPYLERMQLFKSIAMYEQFQNKHIFLIEPEMLKHKVVSKK